jgi:thioredoxin 1
MKAIDKLTNSKYNHNMNTNSLTNAKVLTAVDFEELKKTNGYYLIDFHAVWCGPCKVMSPIIDTLSLEDDLKSVQFLKCDVDDQPEIAELFTVSSIPTFYLIKTQGDGEFSIENNVVKKFVGTKSAFDFKQEIMKAVAPAEA